jgi:dipeptidyl aminopeptidase/acylaminoacyl peptidase
MKTPFLILHDPHEEVVSIEGSRRLFAQAKTPVTNKKLVELPGYLHGLLCNHPKEVLSTVTEWMLDQEQQPTFNGISSM